MTSITSSCSTLKYALCELDAVIQRDETHDSKMQNPLSNLYVASLKKVYDKGNLIGRIRMYNDHVWKWITFNSDQISLLESVDAIIHHLFDQVITAAYQARQSHLAYQIQMIETHFKLDQSEENAKALRARYLNHLTRELQGANVSLLDLAANFDANLFGKTFQCRDLDAIRNLVTNVSQAVIPFWYKMLHYQHTYRSSLEEYLPINFPLASPEKPISGAINGMRLYDAIWKEQCWIDLEGHIEQTIPVIELIKICQPVYQLDIREKKRLDKWISGLNDYINRSKEKFEKMQKAVELIKNAFSEIVNAVEIQGQLSISLGMLINQLDDRGCHLMHLEDPQHRAWQRELKKGDTLECKGKIYVLHDELLSRKMIKKEKTRSDKIPINRYRVFKLSTHPQLVIKIGKAPFDLSLDSYKFKKYHFGIPSVEGVQNVLETDDGHPFVLLEFLPQSLAEHRWTSSSFKLSPKDEEICSRIASFLFCMRDWRLWPNQIYPEVLYMDSAKILTITACLDCGPSPEIPEEDYCGPENYLASEKFCLKVAKINQREAHLPILHYLMNVSEYNMHCMAQFYRKSVVTMLKTGEFDFLNVSLPYGYDHSVYKKRLTKLFSQAKAMRANCLYRVTDYRESIPKELKEAFLIKTIKSINNWHHFVEQKSSHIEEIAKIDRELVNVQKEKMKQREASLELLKKNQFHENTNTIKTEMNGDSNLNEMEKKLILDKKNRYDKIFELTVFDRLINAYLESGTPGIISEKLIEIVLESFKNPIEIEEDSVTNNNLIPSVFNSFKNLLGNVLGNFKNPIEVRQTTANSYYQAQKELIIAKNQYAIKLIKDEIEELSNNPKALFHL